MRTSTATSAEIFAGDLRMDASYHASEENQASHVLKSSKLQIDRLDSVCQSDGIFIPDRFRRVYVDNPKFGLKWLSPTDMEMADLSGLKYVSSKYTTNLDSLRIHQGWILLSRSGTIGNLAYVRPDMDGLIASDDIIRIVADPSKIKSGYLHTVLSSPLIVSLIRKKMYGAVIPHIEVQHIIDLPIPRLDPTQKESIHQLIEQAADQWSKSQYLLEQARNHFNYLTTQEITTYFPHNYDISTIKSSNLEDRFGAHYHSFVYHELEEAIRQGSYKELGDLSSRIFAPSQFKHIYLTTPNNYPFITGGDLVNRRISNVRFLSKYGMQDISDYIVKEGWLAIYKSGQLDSMLGTTFYINKKLDGFCLSDHVIRVLIDQSQINTL